MWYVELPAGREGEAPPLPGIVEVRLPVGFYDEPAPEGVPGLHSMRVADWLPVDVIHVELARRNAHDAVSSWRHLLDDLPPIFIPV